MILGLSFGKKKTTTDQTSDVNKTDTLVGSQSQATTGFNQSNTATTSTGNQSTTGTTTGSTTTNQQQQDTGTQRQTGTTTTLGADVTEGLSAAVKSLLAGGINDANIASLSNMIAGRAGFDADSMVSNIVTGARTRGEQELQERNASIQSAVGGTDITNSMAALLAERGRNDLESNLAGIEGAARAQAEGIANQNLQAGVAAQGSLADQAAGLGSVLKGAETTVDMATLTDQISQLLGTQGTTQNVSQNTATAETQNTATTQLLAELVNALTNQQQTTVGTEHTKGTQKGSGGGLSLNI